MTASMPIQLSGGMVNFFAPDRKSTRLNSSHLVISYAVFCLKKKLVPVWIVFRQLKLNAPARIIASALRAINDYQGVPARYVRMYALFFLLFFFFNDTATPEIYALSLHDALPI